MSLDQKILADFALESQKIILSLKKILSEVEGQMPLASKLKDFGNQVDRIMGAAQSLALAMSEDHALDLMAEYSALCKVLAYKTSAITNNLEFYNLCVSLLKEGANTLEILVKRINDPYEDLTKAIDVKVVERFRWVSDQMAQENPQQNKANAEGDNKMSQDDIDKIFKKLGK